MQAGLSEGVYGLMIMFINNGKMNNGKLSFIYQPEKKEQGVERGFYFCQQNITTKHRHLPVL